MDASSYLSMDLLYKPDSTCPLRHPVASEKRSNKAHDFGTLLQAFSFFLPRVKEEKYSLSIGNLNFTPPNLSIVIQGI